MANDHAHSVLTSSGKLLVFMLIAWLHCLVRAQAGEELGPSESVTVERIVNAWKERQETTTSASFTWEIDRTDFNRWSTYQSEYRSDKQETSAHDTQSLSFQGPRVRAEMQRWRPQDYQEFSGFSPDSTGPGAATRNAYLSAWKTRFSDSAAQTQAPYRHVWVFDGGERVDIHDGHAGTPVAFKAPDIVNDRGEYPYLNDLLSRPIMLAFRPQYWAGKEVSIDDIGLVEDDSGVQGKSCLVIEYSLDESATTRLWVDPGRNFHVLRLISYDAGESRYQIDIEYEQYLDAAWTPQSWTIVLLSDCRQTPGRSDLFQFVACRITERSVNQPLPAELFHPSLATGTYLVDLATNRKYQVTGDGATRPLSPEEIVLVRNALEIANPEANEGSLIRWYQVAAILFLVVCGASLYWRRLHSSKRPDALESLPSNLTGDAN